MSVKEMIFLGLPGPTHNYAGLSTGNFASEANAGSESSPRTAALQVLKLAKLLKKYGVSVGVIPFQPRPDWRLLEKAGFKGKDALKLAYKNAPQLLAAAYSSSAMWVANAGIFTANRDSISGKAQFTVANLISNLHRSIEAKSTYRVLSQIFGKAFEVKKALPKTEYFADEGAANHMRIAASHDSEGLNIFVYGKNVLGLNNVKNIPIRQSLQACQAVARSHKIKNSIFIKQDIDAIKAGVFHNDVIAVSNENLLLYHEAAFDNTPYAIDEIRKEYSKMKTKKELVFIKIKESELSLASAVKTYLFNSQIITIAKGQMLLIAPVEVKENERASKLVEKIIKDKENPITKVEYVNLKQSMKNGGGPACLRLRILLDQKERKKINPEVILDTAKLKKLEEFVEKYYPEKLKISDLQEEKLASMGEKAAIELEKILKLRII